MNLNKASLIGNLTRAPEVRYTQYGSNMTTFGLATNRAWRNEAGDLQEEVTYHNIVAFGHLGEIAADHLVKGQQVYVEGRIQTRAYGESEGRKLYRTDIIASQIQFGAKPQPKDEDAADNGVPVEAVVESPPLDQDQSDDIPF